MSIENSDPWARYSYRIAPHDPCIVQRKRNQLRARWQEYRVYGNEYDAKAALFRLARIAAEEHQDA